MPMSSSNSEKWLNYPSINVLREYFLAKAGSIEFFRETSFMKYVECVKMFTEDLGYDSPESALQDLRGDPDEAARKLQTWIRILRGRGNAPATQRVKVARVKRWARVNDLEVNWDKVTIPTLRPVISDRAPTKEELRKILAYAPTWLVPAILTLASSGMRVGSLIKLKLKHMDLDRYPDIGVIEVPPEANKAGVGYFTCVTPEAKDAFKKYLERRRRSGEELGPESPFIKGPMSGGVTYTAMRHAYHGTLKRAGLDMKSRRVYVLHIHTLRKFFRSQVEGILTKSIREAMMGHMATEYLDKNYLRIPEHRLVQEYRRAVPALTIFEDVTSKDYQKRQLLRQAALLLPEDKLRMLQEILARTDDIDKAVEEFRKLRKQVNYGEHKVVQSEEEMLRMLDEGWELVRELNGSKFLMKK